MANQRSYLSTSGLWFAASARIFFRFGHSSAERALGFQNATRLTQKLLMTMGGLGYGVSGRLSALTVFPAWGHRFLYGSEILSGTLAEAASCDAVQQQPGVKARPKLCRLQQHVDSISEWLKQFENMPFEGTAA
jgi:hypothetical protein